jgi:chemotaxis methyl-accepting protein methylase
MRALDIRSKTVQIVRPTDMNVVFQQDVISDENKFDLVIGTNVFVYYGGFEQALALRNLAGMMRSGGILLSNNFLQIFPGSLFKEAGRTIAPISNAEAETIFFYRRD